MSLQEREKRGRSKSKARKMANAGAAPVTSVAASKHLIEQGIHAKKDIPIRKAMRDRDHGLLTLSDPALTPTSSPNALVPDPCDQSSVAGTIQPDPSLDNVIEVTSDVEDDHRRKWAKHRHNLRVSPKEALSVTTQVKSSQSQPYRRPQSKRASLRKLSSPSKPKPFSSSHAPFPSSVTAPSFDHTFTAVAPTTAIQPSQPPQNDRYILYLEPSQDSVFRRQIVHFFQESIVHFGPNEAQQYHPHCSMTGFFELPKYLYDEQHGSSSTDTSMMDIVSGCNKGRLRFQEIIQVLDETIADYFRPESTDAMPIVKGFHFKAGEKKCTSTSSAASSSINGASSPPINPDVVVQDLAYLHIKTQSEARKYLPTFRIKLDAPQYHGLANAVKENFARRLGITTLRAKAVDHISLAYIHLAKPLASSQHHHSYGLRPRKVSASTQEPEPTPSSTPAGNSDDNLSTGVKAFTRFYRGNFRRSYSLIRTASGSADDDVMNAVSGKESPTLTGAQRSSRIRHSRQTTTASTPNPIIPAAIQTKAHTPSPLDFEGLYTLASQCIDLDEARKSNWDVVLYRETYHSEALGIPHQFEEMKRWSDLSKGSVVEPNENGLNVRMFEEEILALMK